MSTLRVPEGSVAFRLWCRNCREQFTAFGQVRRELNATPAIEWICCPRCRAARRMMLPPEIEGPVVGVSAEVESPAQEVARPGTEV